MPTYAEKLKDPRWQRKRLEVLERSEFKCRDCGAGDKTLHVHHAYYTRGADPWDYEDDALMALCEDCHESRQEMQNCVLAFLAFLNPSAMLRVFGFVAGEASLKPRSAQAGASAMYAFLKEDESLFLEGAAAALGMEVPSLREALVKWGRTSEGASFLDLLRSGGGE